MISTEPCQYQKMKTWSCFFDVGLETWQTNMDIKSVFNEYKAVSYMCQ